jgi:hypothetical protein
MGRRATNTDPPAGSYQMYTWSNIINKDLNLKIWLRRRCRHSRRTKHIFYRGAVLFGLKGDEPNTVVSFAVGTKRFGSRVKRMLTQPQRRRDSEGGSRTVNRGDHVSEHSSDEDDESIDGTDWREVAMRLKGEDRRRAKTHNAKCRRRVVSLTALVVLVPIWWRKYM